MLLVNADAYVAVADKEYRVRGTTGNSVFLKLQRCSKKSTSWANLPSTRERKNYVHVVKTFFENRFNAALAYEKSLNSAKQLNIPFKKNLELEAILLTQTASHLHFSLTSTLRVIPKKTVQ